MASSRIHAESAVQREQNESCARPVGIPEGALGMYEILIASLDPATVIDVPGCDSLSSDSTGRYRATWEEMPTSLVTIVSTHGGFSLRPDELALAGAMLVRPMGIAVMAAWDNRSYSEIESELQARGGATALASFEVEKEESFAAASARSRALSAPTWLGLSRDFRIFSVGLASVGAGSAGERILNWISPQRHSNGVSLAETGNVVHYKYSIGRGLGPQNDVRRELLDGDLPILKAHITDGALQYAFTAFASLEVTPLTAMTNLGTDYLLADGHGVGHTFTPEQREEFDRRVADFAPAEETVLFVRIVAKNTSRAPRHAFVTLPAPYLDEGHLPVSYDFDEGFNQFSVDRVFCTAKVNGKPAAYEELSILVPPGDQVTVDFYLPHSPISAQRALALRSRNFDEVLDETAAYWRGKLESAASISVPDKSISDMISAGLLHLDLITYGSEPSGTVAPTIGVYSPIGSESAPITQYFDSVGWTNLAARSLDYFAQKQHADGFMQNFNGYMLETEAALWSFGEHYRYTADLDWLRSVQSTITAGVEHILKKRNEQKESGIQPHGLLVGKTADPDDFVAAYMLNGYAYLGLSRAAEMISDINHELAASWRQAASELREDIRASFDASLTASPLVPLSDGSWSRSAPPWAGQAGPAMLDRSAVRFLTHGTITTRDALIGPLWLTFQEVIDPSETLTKELLEFAADVMFHDNTAFSQPYYSPHPLAHLRRGEVGAFLRAYYTMASSLADRETHTFWEHYFHVSPHKTHEEAWFLMQSRWMLYLEDGSTLRLFSGIPRAWLQASQQVAVIGARSYFGSLSVVCDVADDGRSAEIDVTLDADRAPRDLVIRVPHPARAAVTGISGGSYDATTESVHVESPGPRTKVVIRWA